MKRSTPFDIPTRHGVVFALLCLVVCWLVYFDLIPPNIILSNYMPRILEYHTFNVTAQNATDSTIKDENSLQYAHLFPDIPVTTGTERGIIFYNLYAPANDSENAERIVGIVKEQMAERNKTARDVPPLYNLIDGRNTALATSKDFCSPNCHLLRHMDAGNEVDTLQALHEYCTLNPDETVAYIHDKGSYHEKWNSAKRRRLGTRGAFECLSALTTGTVASSNDTGDADAVVAASSCNVCAAKFNVFPHYHAFSNMWAARCSYVRALLPPRRYGTKMQAMYDELLSTENDETYRCVKPLPHMEENYLGIGRYAMEHWVWGHPHVEPCEVLPMGPGKAPDQFPAVWKGILRRAPTKNATESGIGDGPYKTTWSRLEGRLHEFRRIYDLEPSATSWIWSYYRGYEKGAHVC